jgi:hypothetical protein
MNADPTLPAPSKTSAETTPVGAILCGFVAAVGYWVGARLFQHRPSRLLLGNIVLVSLTTFFAIHRLNYTHALARGIPLESQMSFPDYLIAVTEHMKYKLGASSEEATELGKWGWGIAALQVFGFCFGGFAVYRLLTSVPYCSRCSMYFGKVWKRVSHWKNLDAMDIAWQSVSSLLRSGQLQAAVDLHATLDEARRFRVQGFLCMYLRKCPGCENRRLALLAKKRRGMQFATVASLVIPTELPICKAP